MTTPTDLSAARNAKAGQNGNSAPPPETRWPAPSSPMPVAKRYAADLHTVNDTRTLRRWRGTWITWPGTGAWVDAEDAAMRAEMYDALHEATYWHPEKGELPWAPNRSKIANVLEALDAVTHLSGDIETPAWIDGAAGPPPDEIVACRNGLLHVTTRELHDHDPRFFTRAAVPFDYDPDAPSPAQWHGFLHDLWGDDTQAVEALQEWFGYVLSGSTRQQKILLMHGPKRSGKGTIARVLQGLVGAGNYVNPTLASLAENFGLANLIGKPLAVVGDARLGKGDVHRTTERLLSISGEDGLTVDRKYRDPWNGQLPCRFMVLTNELPDFGEVSDAIAGRFIILTLTRSWFGKENAELTDGLLHELPGILLWALDGLERLTRRGRFLEPASSASAVEALRRMSPMSAFVADRVRVDAGLSVKRADLFEAWGRWCETNNEKKGSASHFGRNLRTEVPAVRDSRETDETTQKQVWCYSGVELRTLDDDGGPREDRPKDELF